MDKADRDKYCFRVAPLPKKIYNKYKEICQFFEINGHEATGLAFEVLYDCMKQDFDKVKARLGLYTTAPEPTPAPAAPEPPPADKPDDWTGL